MKTISFLSNTATNPISRILKNYRCVHFDINTVIQTLNSKITTDYLVILLDINYYGNDGFLEDEAFVKLNELSALLSIFRQNNKAKVIFANTAGHFLDINSELNIKQYQKLLTLNSQIEELSHIGDIAVLNIYQWVNYLGYQRFYNLKNGFLFQAPYTKEAFICIADAIDEKIKLFENTRKKVLALDADNTLWGGIVGEDGLEGIDIDENYPGIIYRFFQQQLKYLQQSGILLALVSKNNLADVKEVFDNKNMPLKWDDFVATKINWLPKSQNITAIAKSLNVGLDSIIFIDDNDFELQQVSTALNIDTIKISTDDPIKNLNIFNHFTAIKTLNISNEDGQKTQQYKTQNQREQDKKLFTDMDDYLRSIDMQINMKINNKDQIKRVTQLINKTNQFNLTTKRYSESEVLSTMKTDQVFSFSLVDKFGDLGLIAVVIIKNHDIDTFLMSCRVLGRNIEQKILHLITKNIQLPLTASYIKTAKNSQVACLYDSLAFTLSSEINNVKIYQLKKPISNINYIAQC